MIKVLYFLNNKVRGGVEEHVLCLLKGLNRSEFDPLIVCPEELIELMSKELKEYNVKSYPICIRQWTQLKEIKNFLNVLKQEKPDIVHSHLLFATMFAAPLSKLAKVPKVIDTAHIREAWRKGIKKAYFIDRFFYSFVDEIIAVSDAIKRYLVETKKLPSSKIVVIKNGVELTKFKVPKGASAQVPKSPGEHGNMGTGNKCSSTQEPRRTWEPETWEHGNLKLKVGVIGRLEEQKGHKYFLEAIHKLGEEANRAEFLIVGDGSLRKSLETMAKDLNITAHVKFLGYRSDVVDILKSLDIFVLPSLFEGLPLVALEASAMGKAIIVTNVDGSPEAVIHKETGLVVPAKDSDALKDAMLELMNDNHKLIQYGKNAKKFIEENFDIKKQIRETGEIYKKTCRP